MSADDLDCNPFYRLLQTTYRSKFDEAQENCWLVCVPHADSLKGIKITSKFVDTHILRPSPFFKSQYTCGGYDLKKSLEFDGSHIRAVSGFPTEVEAKVIGEELSYNKDFKPYRLLTISRPLEGDRPGSPQVKNEVLASVDAETCLSCKECLTFLQSFPQYAPVLKKLDKKLEDFCVNYMILPEYLHDTAQKLNDIVSWAGQAIARLQSPPFGSQDATLQKIMLALESYTLGVVQKRVFGAVKQFCLEEDSALECKLKQLHRAGFSPDQLGVRDAFCCPVPRAVVELASLDSKLTPLEKLWCLKTTLKVMSEEIYESTPYNTARLKNPHEQLHLTSDDLIPILVCLIVKCKLPHLESNLYYIQNFSWHLPDKDMLGYTLVTFQAAKEFIKSQDTSCLKPSSTNMKGEITPLELMQMTAQLDLSEKPKQPDAPEKPQGGAGTSAVRSRSIDRQLEQVTKLIESATKELQTREVQDLQELFKNGEDSSNKAGVGEFFVGLQDSLGVTYGKL